MCMTNAWPEGRRTAASDLSGIRPPSPQFELFCDACRKDPGMCHYRFKMAIKATCPGPDLVCFLMPNRYDDNFWKMGSTAFTYTDTRKTSSQISNPHSFSPWTLLWVDLSKTLTQWPHSLPPPPPALPPVGLQLNPKLPLYKSSSVSSIQRGTSGLNSFRRIGNRETVWSCVKVEWWWGGWLEVEGERWIS